jgi:hypothetical protein
MARYKKIVEDFRDGDKRSRWSEDSGDEFFRSACFDIGHNRGWDQNNDRAFAECVECSRFVLTYNNKVRKLGNAITRLEDSGAIENLGLGDDGFGDMTDSFPLHGRRKYEAALKGKLPEKYHLGENYVAMYLEEAMLKWLGICARDLIKGEE